MTPFFVTAAVFLLLTFAAGAIRIALGPTDADRMLSAQLFGTTGVAILLLMAHGLQQPSLIDVALVFALLAVVSTVTFVRRPRAPRPLTRSR
jgi:multicomponent Na+:H+ antiporter subunit F